MDVLTTLAAERRALTPTQWLLNVFAGSRTATGKRVNVSDAFGHVVFYRCVSLMAETIASLPIMTYERLLPAGRQRASDHYLYPILHDEPNPEMTSFEFWEALQGHVETWGNGFAEIEDTNGGRVKALWPLRPDRMEVKRVGAQERRLEYRYTLPQGQTVVLPPENVLHLRGLSPDGLVGYSRVSLLREAIGLGLALDEYAARFFGNDARPGGILTSEKKLGKDGRQNLKDSWEAGHRGLTNAHRIAVLEDGVSWQAIGIPPQDAQFLESRRYQDDQIARAFGVPPHKVGIMTQSTNNNIEHQALEFVQDAVRTRVVRNERALARSLLTERERQTYYFEFLVDALLRADFKTRWEGYSFGVQSGILAPDEPRQLENLNPQPDGMGTLPLRPLNMVPANSFNRDNGLRVMEQVNAAGVLVRSGFDPEDALRAVGLDPIKHLGKLPVTVQPEPEPAPAALPAPSGTAGNA